MVLGLAHKVRYRVKVIGKLLWQSRANWYRICRVRWFVHQISEHPHILLIFVYSFFAPFFSSIQILGRHQQFQTELARDFHVRHIPALFMFLVVVEVLNHFLQDHGVQVLEMADAGH